MEIKFGIKMMNGIMMIEMTMVNYYQQLFMQMEVNNGIKMVNFIIFSML